MGEYSFFSDMWSSRISEDDQNKQVSSKHRFCDSMVSRRNYGIDLRNLYKQITTSSELHAKQFSNGLHFIQRNTK